MTNNFLCLLSTKKFLLCNCNSLFVPAEKKDLEYTIWQPFGENCKLGGFSHPKDAWNKRWNVFRDFCKKMADPIEMTFGLCTRVVE